MLGAEKAWSLFWTQGVCVELRSTHLRQICLIIFQQLDNNYCILEYKIMVYYFRDFMSVRIWLNEHFDDLQAL